MSFHRPAVISKLFKAFLMNKRYGKLIVHCIRSAMIYLL